MIVGFLWIAAGLMIAFASGIPNGEPLGTSQGHVVVTTWHLTLTGAVGLLLAAEGCRIFQASWFMWRRYR
jgi:hypothetical protein